MKKNLFYRLSAIIICGMLLIIPIHSEIPTKRVYSKNREKTKQVALTFDDGPHPRYTKDILKILDEYHIKATFFVIGVNAKNYPEAMEAIASSECEIGNHTFSHLNLKNMSVEEIKNELSKCEEEINQNSKKCSKLLRPPQGAFDIALENISSELGYDIILWSIDTMDWAHTPAQSIVDKTLKNLKDGDIILMHDYVSGENTTCEALKNLIPAILQRGYEFVTVSELINGEVTP